MIFMKHPVSRKTTAALSELEQESTRMAACLCAAIDATIQAASYAAKKGAAVCFSPDNISSIGLSLYIRRRDEAKSANNHFSKKLVRDLEARTDAGASQHAAPEVTDGAR